MSDSISFHLLQTMRCSKCHSISEARFNNGNLEAVGCISCDNTAIIDDSRVSTEHGIDYLMHNIPNDFFFDPNPVDGEQQASDLKAQIFHQVQHGHSFRTVEQE